MIGAAEMGWMLGAFVAGFLTAILLFAFAAWICAPLPADDELVNWESHTPDTPADERSRRILVGPVKGGR